MGSASRPFSAQEIRFDEVPKMLNRTPSDRLKQLFSGLTEHTFLTRMGVADPPLIDYLAGMLSRFVHTDAIYQFRGSSGKPITELSELINEADTLPEGGHTRREFYRHIGDMALFWAGLFPEALERNPGGWGSYAVLNYTRCGKRSYLIASSYEGEQFSNESPILRRLSEQFELCATGLREVRRDWEVLADEIKPGQGLIN